MSTTRKIYYLHRILATVCALAVTAGAYAQNPYIHRVYEYRPAPGQFVNVLPEYEEGDDAESMRLKAEECLKDNAQVMISLGAFGGYVVFGFDHMVENKPDEMDLLILGNAFYEASASLEDEAHVAGSSEPGTVWVSHDDNANGLPDDAWYELAGSEHHNPLTTHGLCITYLRPDEAKTPVKGLPFESDTEYIRWTDSKGDDGYVVRNTYHRQPYFPQWLDTPSLTFTGTLLPVNSKDLSGGNGTSVQQTTFAYGYADNHPNTSVRAMFNLDWAVDGEGRHVRLPGIHFVKIQSGTRQNNGWLGESSTEVLGAADLHLSGNEQDDFTSVPVVTGKPADEGEEWYSLQGIRVYRPRQGGVYILRQGGQTRRILRK